MSSGSSGKSVTVPEPSRSMFCLMSFIFVSRSFIMVVGETWKIFPIADWRR